MSKELFQVEPVTGYDGARYPAAFDPGADDVAEERRHPLVVAATLFLLVGIAVGVIGCYLRTDYHPDPPEPQTDGGPGGDGGDGDADGDGGLPPACDDGALRCADSSTVETCETGEWVAESCGEICAEAYGPMGYSLGCDAAADDPCQCMDDIIAGERAVCTPGDIMCLDEWTLGRCDDAAWDWVPQDCNTYCAETFGYDYYSLGCDTDAEDPCMCEYGIIDGDMPMCEPGDMICLDDATLGVCGDDSWDYVPVDCDERCVEQNGAGYTSPGCDLAAEDPCQCEPPPDDSGE